MPTCPRQRHGRGLAQGGFPVFGPVLALAVWNMGHSRQLWCRPRPGGKVSLTDMGSAFSSYVGMLQFRALWLTGLNSHPNHTRLGDPVRKGRLGEAE